MRRRGNKQRGLALISFALAMLVLTPIIGLGVDSAMLYITKERLLSAAQLSLRSAHRAQNPEEAVGRYFNANFPEGFLGVQERTIRYVAPGKLHAAVQAPTYFMKIIRISTVKVEASAELPAASN